MKNNPTPSTWVILAGGVVVLIGSFLDFYSEGPFGASAWSSSEAGVKLGLFPVAIIPVLCGVLMALHVGLTTFADVKFPDRLAGFGWTQLHLVLGFQAAIMMIAYLIRDFGLDKATGFWLMLLGSIALIVGAVLRTREPAAPPAAGPPPSTPPPASPPPPTPPQG